MLGAALAVKPKDVMLLTGMDTDPLAGTVTHHSALVPGAKLMGLNVDTPGQGPPDSTVSGAMTAILKQKKRLTFAHALNKINPEWLKTKRRQNAKAVQQFDMDLASLHSVSLAAKVAFQRERNYEREYIEETEWMKIRLDEYVAMQTLGGQEYARGFYDDE